MLSCDSRVRLWPVCTSRRSAKLYEKYKELSQALADLQKLQLDIEGSAKSCEDQIRGGIEGIFKELRSYETMLIKEVHRVKETKLTAVGQQLGGVKAHVKKLSQV